MDFQLSFQFSSKEGNKKVTHKKHKKRLFRVNTAAQVSPPKDFPKDPHTSPIQSQIRCFQIPVDFGPRKKQIRKKRKKN